MLFSFRLPVLQTKFVFLFESGTFDCHSQYWKRKSLWWTKQVGLIVNDGKLESLLNGNEIISEWHSLNVFSECHSPIEFH